MLFDLFAWILITVLCYGWGEWFCTRFAVDPEDGQVPVYAMAGLAVIGVTGLYLSLAGPLNLISRLVFFLVPVARFIFFPAFRKKMLTDFSRLFSGGRWPGNGLVVFCLLAVLLISASPVIHPDTLNYHQYSVRLFRDYGSLTGVANARADLGFQSSWFAALSIFDPGIITGTTSFPLAGAVMAWFILYLRPAVKGKGILPKERGEWFALALLIFTMASWTQIRLTAASASPDFITAINVMAAFYFFVRQPPRNFSTDFLAILFSFAALLTKLSAFPVLLIPAFICFDRLRAGRFKAVAGVGVFGLIMLLPMIIRSYLESGYLLYPSLMFNLFQPDWKMPSGQVVALQQYIRAYARYPLPSSETASLLHVPFSVWGKTWWQHLYLIDKLLLSIVALAFVAVPVFLRRFMRTLSVREKKGFGIALAGVIFWFAFGPDPRFGSGFLLSFVSIAAIPFFGKISFWPAKRSGIIFQLLETGLLLAVAGYFIYRISSFGRKGEWFLPAGIENKAIDNPDCTDQVKKLIFPDLPYRDGLTDSCRRFRLRGARVSEGFAPLR